MNPLTIYTAASFRHLHAVRLFHDALRARVPDIQILDWTDKAVLPEGLTPDERRRWFDTEQAGGQVYDFCADACRHADIVVYLGASGQDAGVEVGLASAAGVPVLGIRGPLEAPGLMLHGVVTLWCQNVLDAVRIISDMDGCQGASCGRCRAKRICDKLGVSS